MTRSLRRNADCVIVAIVAAIGAGVGVVGALRNDGPESGGSTQLSQEATFGRGILWFILMVICLAVIGWSLRVMYKRRATNRRWPEHPIRLGNDSWLDGVPRPVRSRPRSANKRRAFAERSGMPIDTSREFAVKPPSFEYPQR